jgi:hypothetical protein
MKTLKHLHINQPTKNTFQVRIVRDGKERSRLFSFRPWGGKNKALAAAISWRDQVIIAYNINTKRRTAPLKNNRSTGILGISKSIQTDYRKGFKYLVYGVNWVDSAGKRHSKQFRAGNVETYSKKMDERAFASAKKFRSDYERHIDINKVHLFDPSKYLDWRNTDVTAL